MRHLTQNLPQVGVVHGLMWPSIFSSPNRCGFQEDKSQQKTVVRERLEQLRRERSSILQSKRDR